MQIFEGTVSASEGELIGKFSDNMESFEGTVTILKGEEKGKAYFVDMRKGNIVSSRQISGSNKSKPSKPSKKTIQSNQNRITNKEPREKKSSGLFGKILTAVVAGALINEVAKSDTATDLVVGFLEGMGNNDNDWDWDYLPESRQWRCRGLQTGQFANNNNCTFDTKDDDRWPN